MNDLPQRDSKGRFIAGSSSARRTIRGNGASVSSLRTKATPALKAALQLIHANSDSVSRAIINQMWRLAGGDPQVITEAWAIQDMYHKS